jgi:hypothetical protein
VVLNIGYINGGGIHRVVAYKNRPASTVGLDDLRLEPKRAIDNKPTAILEVIIFHLHWWAVSKVKRV